MVIEDPKADHTENDGIRLNDGLPNAARTEVENPVLKKVRIQTGVLTRLMKDHTLYVTESDRILAEVERMKVSGDCPHDIRQRSEMYAESKRMVPHVLSKLQAARDALFTIVETECTYPSLKETPALILEARSRIEAATALLQDRPCATRTGTDEASAESDGTEY